MDTSNPQISSISYGSEMRGRDGRQKEKEMKENGKEGRRIYPCSVFKSNLNAIS
jgi:hypothetical protein